MNREPVGGAPARFDRLFRSLSPLAEKPFDKPGSFRYIPTVMQAPPDKLDRNTALTGAILAGGRSRRMGQNKALLRVAGKALIEHVVDAVRHQVEELMVISNQPEAFAFLNLPIYRDAVTSCGPLAGIYTALKHARAERCLVVACDLPFLSAGLIQFLRENAGPEDVLVFESESGVQPLCASYRRTCLPLIERQIAAGAYKVADFLEQVKTRRVRLDAKLAFYDDHLFFNVNTPEELERARRWQKEGVRTQAEKSRDED